MTEAEVLEQLTAFGTEQTRKTYRRHGVVGPQYGVKFGDLYKIQKKIKIDHELARRLWANGSYEARVLATLVADPAQLKEAEAEAWAKEIDCDPLAGALSDLVARTPFARKKAEKWARSKDEILGTAGWAVLARLTSNAELPDDYFVDLLTTIEKEIHGRKNRVRYAMNGALISIGGRSEALRELALAAARRIGPVEVDHGDTDCKTPEATAYIAKMWERKKK